MCANLKSPVNLASKYFRSEFGGQRSRDLTNYIFDRDSKFHTPKMTKLNTMSKRVKLYILYYPKVNL